MKKKRKEKKAEKRPAKKVLKKVPKQVPGKKSLQKKMPGKLSKKAKSPKKAQKAGSLTATPQPHHLGQPSAKNQGPDLVAAIDVGSTALRMVIAQVRDSGEVRVLESLQHPVQLGKNTFTKGRIEPETIEECVRILSGFKNLLAEYGIPLQEVRAVATSSVREAANRDTFVDRLYVATLLQIEVIEEAEENRLTYLAARHLIPDDAPWNRGYSLIVEVGGGNTELLLLHDGHVIYTNSYRFGSLRMRETLETSKVPAERMKILLEQQISRSVEQIQRSVPAPRVDSLIAVSGDMRYASSILGGTPTLAGFRQIALKPFGAFAEKIACISVDELVRKHHLSFQDAETLGPALMAYRELARGFGIKTFVVSPASLREGLLQEMVTRGSWSREFAEQAVHAAMALGKKYQCDERHARHVASMALSLFQALQPEHGLAPRYELLLHLAALLHDIGMFVSSRAHHKHSMYLILNSDLFGLSLVDKILIGLVARYHRRASPSAEHQEYAVITRENRMVVTKLAAMLRIADALDRNHLQHFQDLRFERENGQFVILVPEVEDLTLERQAVKEKGTLFEEIYGLKVVLRRQGTEV